MLALDTRYIVNISLLAVNHLEIKIYGPMRESWLMFELFQDQS